MTATRLAGRVRGVSLIEALVAMAVMAFGLVAIVGLQATLRNNGDISKQRAEAVRLAQEQIETWRAFVSLQANAGVGWADIVDMPDLDVASPNTNAVYTVSRRVPPSQAPAPKTIIVNVSWRDRSDQLQTVTIHSSIAGISPELAGALVLPQNALRPRDFNGRNVAIPRSAKNFGDGTSGFVPPQSSGPKTAWVFNNVTGIIERICTVDKDLITETLTAAAVAADLDSCDASRAAQLLAGFVNFADVTVQPDEAEAEAPTGLPLNLDMDLTLTSAGHPEPGHTCFDDSPLAAESLPRPVAYFCAIYMNPERRWAGRLRVKALAFEERGSVPWSIGTKDVADASARIVCRYSTLPNDGGPNSKNSAHPLSYTLSGSAAGAALRDQNFLVIRGTHNCPVDALSDDDLVDASTRVHQNGSEPYI